jgi:hypothetical protein
MSSPASHNGLDNDEDIIRPFDIYAKTLASLYAYDPRALPPPSSTTPIYQSKAGLSSVIGRTPTKETIWNVGTPTTIP